MKKTLLFLSFVLLSISNPFAQIQQTTKSIPVLGTPLERGTFNQLQAYKITPPNLQTIHQEDAERDKNGMFYRIGVTTNVYYTPQNSGTWETLPNGDKQWKIRIKSTGASALTVFFNKFKVFGDSYIQAFDVVGRELSSKFDVSENQTTEMTNIPLIKSDDIILVLFESKDAISSQIEISEIGYAYRGVGEILKQYGDSDPCQNDINGSVGNGWQNEKKGVARILAKEGGAQGWCSGSLINNQLQDCKPYFLTALHCGVNSSTADFNQWKFFFNFEKPTYTSDNVYSTSDPNVITGCVFKASSKDGGGTNGSDYLLVQLGNTTNESTIVNRLKNNIGAYWNGYNATNTASPNGASIHHPSGDVKKISLYTNTLTTTGWNGNGLQSHWYVKWSNGVTEGGSSGSPIFNNNHLIVGTLTGGSSYCTAPNSPDMYGKMYYHWDKNTTSGHIDLKTILDPNNTGTTVLEGSFDPCSDPTAPPVANFTVAQTTVSVNTTVIFNNTSTNNPTTNTWTITPSSGWTFAGGTNASSKNPQIKFTQVGDYTVKLQAANSFGSDTKLETNYIHVVQSTGACSATSLACDEYIGYVKLNTLVNTTGCDNYTYYTTPTTTLNKGQQYPITIHPYVDDEIGIYQGDIMAAWIDYNQDGQFTSNERIFYQESASATGEGSFTVPTSALSGSTTLRVRINYNTIDPCGTSDWGEVEDYKITIAAASSNPPVANFTADQTTVPVNTTVTFTNSSTNNPTSNQWTITPASGWSYTGGTSATSKNPKVQFTTVGTYSVSLKATNADGSDTRNRTNYIKVIADGGTAVNDLDGIQNLSIYPNPTSQWVNFSTTSTDEMGIYEIQIIDLAGKIVMTAQTAELNQFKMDVDRLDTGMYQIVIRQGDHISKRKFIKE